MTSTTDRNLRYDVHGVGLESISSGFREIGMPQHRAQAALGFVEEVLAVNGAVDVRWYKPPRTNELCCYWDDHRRNVLWVTINDVHVVNDLDRVARPERTTNWQKEAGAYVGWLLPGAASGGGAGAQQVEVATVICPESFIRVPVGSFCVDCDGIHEA